MSNRYDLSQEKIDFYQENGYVRIPDVLTDQELTRVREAAEEVLQTRYSDDVEQTVDDPEYKKVFIQKVNVWQVHDEMRHHTLNPKIAEIARQLAQVDRIRLWHDHLLVKMPGDSKPTAWHQDYPYWPFDRTGQLSCWMALEDVPEEQGCMSFIPGSHKWGELDPIELDKPADIFDMVPDKDTEELEAVPVPLEAGSCTFHNSLTFHYAGPNTTDQHRWGMVTIYTPDGVRYTGDEHVVTEGLGLQSRDLLDGELFPVLAEN